MNGSLILLQQNICSIDTCWSTCITTFDIKMYFWTWTSIECQSIKGRPPCIVGFDLLVFHHKLPDCRSNCSQIFFIIGVLKKFSIFTGKHLCWSLFSIRLQACRPANLLERGSNTGFFLWISRKFLRTALFIEYLRWLLLWLQILEFEYLYTFPENVLLHLWLYLGWVVLQF